MAVIITIPVSWLEPSECNVVGAGLSLIHINLQSLQESAHPLYCDFQHYNNATR